MIMKSCIYSCNSLYFKKTVESTTSFRKKRMYDSAE